MIHESHPWRNLLIKDAEIIERWAKKQKWTDNRSVLLERKIFIAAYSMRKLAEAKKLSSSFSDKNIACTIFSTTHSEQLTSLNNHKIERLYDLQKPKKASINALSLLDLIIHSLVFAEITDQEERVVGFWVTSEKQQRNLWEVSISNFIALMRHVAVDHPAQAIWIHDPDTEALIEWRGNGEIPRHMQQRIAKVKSRYRRLE